jgi:hypothetical protein
MAAVIRLIAGGVGALILGIALYFVPDMDWYLPLPAFLVAPLLAGLGIVHWRNLQRAANVDAAQSDPETHLPK